VGGIGKPMNGSLRVCSLALILPDRAQAQDVAKAGTLLDGDGWVKGSMDPSKNGVKLA
jgi:hypothetical protein